MFTRLTTGLLAVALWLPAAAAAWTWPATGDVIRGFDYGGGPYTASGHRGIDVSGEPGSPVRAPAAGLVSFAGSLASNGRTLTIRTEDGWAVTLTHLGSIVVSVGDGVAEGETVGTVGEAASGEQAHVQLGIRRADDPRGYVDPLTLLPPRQGEPAPLAAPVAAAPAPQPPVPPAEAPTPVDQVPSVEETARTPIGLGVAPVPRPRARRTSISQAAHPAATRPIHEAAAEKPRTASARRLARRPSEVPGAPRAGRGRAEPRTAAGSRRSLALPAEASEVASPP